MMFDKECEKGHKWTTSSTKGGCPYCSGRFAILGENDLATTHPELASQWHSTKNNDLLVTSVKAGSDKRAWWLCDKGHEWEAKISSRIRNGCPFCGGKKVLIGYNDLATTHPEIAAQWHPTKNDTLPADYTFKSAVKAWWLGSCGHEWESRIFSQHRSGCPFCANFTLLSGVNDFQSRYPDLVKSFWNFEKNTSLPSEIFASNDNTFFWKCSEGHEWEGRIRPVLKKAVCPVCEGKKVWEGYNDFATTHPELASEWHPTKNGDLKPTQVLKTSTSVAWWRDKYGHEWQSIIFERTRIKIGCSICSNRTVEAGFNDLATTHPEIAAQWHLTKNGDLSPTSFTRGSLERIWWKCDKGHCWDTTITTRTRGYGCPYCAKSMSSAENEIANFLKQYVNIEQTNRKLIHPYELDIYVPEKNIAIEFNGLYWHSENAGKSKNYHHNKWVACKEKNVQLVQIWEDEWEANPAQVKRMLLHKLGISEERKIFARKTFVKEVSKKEAEVFLLENHIQGFASGSHYLGLVDKSNSASLVALLVIKKYPTESEKTLNIIRYATNANVVGGFTKLLTYAEKTYQPEKFITFSDHCVSDGGLYEKNGFIADKELAPDYMYVVGRSRAHKFGYRLKRFKSDPSLVWEEGLSERELAILNGLNRIWDAGKTRWVKEITS